MIIYILKTLAMNKIKYFLILLLLIINKSRAQQPYPVTDTTPVLIDGLSIGYNIKSQEVKAVGDKGDFSRYAIRFYVTNTGYDKIVRNREGFINGGNVSDQLVQFNILNATGARLTSNTAIIRAAPFNEFRYVDEKDPHTNNMEHHKKNVQVGFWIQAGQTISADEIVIVPLNQRPNVQVVYLAPPFLHEHIENANYNPGLVQNNYNSGLIQNGASIAVDMQGFLKFKNILNSTYINIQNGPPVSSPVEYGWWSAQWQLIPVQGTNYYNIQNRWRGSFLAIDRGYVGLSVNNQSPGSSWSMEPTRDPNVFMIRNVQNGYYLSIANNNLILSNMANNDFSSAWTLEQAPQ